MSPLQFKSLWNEEEGTLSPISPVLLDRFPLSARTKEFLSIAGLPSHAHAYLSFANNSDDLTYGISRIIDSFDFPGEQDKWERYICIGHCRDGDIIAIDTAGQDIILQLDHEDLFAPQLFNSSIESLAGFLILYQEFEESVLEELGEEARRNGLFTDVQFERLRAGMQEIDSRALIEDGFWKDELEIILNLRQEYMDNGPSAD